MKDKNEKLRLSPAALNLFLECPRCFWLEYRGGVHRPRGPFPSLPGGMDLLIKKYFDRYRAVGKLPPELEGKVEGQLFSDTNLLNKWRNWRSGLSFYHKESNAVLCGAIDDCVVHDGLYIPMDYKTRGFDVKQNGEMFYQNQMSCYSLLLEASELPQSSYAYLVYYIPKEVSEKGMVRFAIDVKKVETNSENALALFLESAQILRGAVPDHREECKFCAWEKDIISV